jgi:hypothetical protein
VDATLRFLRMAFAKTQIAGMQLTTKYPGLADISPFTLRNAEGEEVLLKSFLCRLAAPRPRSAALSRLRCAERRLCVAPTSRLSDRARCMHYRVNA